MPRQFFSGFCFIMGSFVCPGLMGYIASQHDELGWYLLVLALLVAASYFAPVRR